MTRLSPIHHAMARTMPVSGGPPCRIGDRARRLGYPIDVRGIGWSHDSWQVLDSTGIWYSLWADAEFPRISDCILPRWHAPRSNP